MTLCAACFLPFLEESWEAVGGTHCGQPATTGLKVFDEAAETPEDESGGERGDADPEASTGLRPVPVKLMEIPVRLRG